MKKPTCFVRAIEVLLRLIEEVAVEQSRQGREHEAQRDQSDDQEAQDEAGAQPSEDAGHEATHQPQPGRYAWCEHAISARRRRSRRRGRSG